MTGIIRASALFGALVMALLAIGFLRDGFSGNTGTPVVTVFGGVVFGILALALALYSFKLHSSAANNG